MNGPLSAMLGQSRAILEVIDEAHILAATDVNVLLTGERGVGKASLARFIHENSTRRQRTMLSINCAQVGESQLECDLFGSGDSAGLFEMAHRSTLLLEEVGAISPRMQALLIRVMENGEIRRLGSERRTFVDVRIISATTRDLLQSTFEEAFRLDLYYRLNVAHLQVPPLRDRTEDISVVMRCYLKALSEEFRLPLCELHPLAVSKLGGYPWPGNIRELRDVAELLALTHAGSVVTVDLLPDMILEQRGSTPRVGAAAVTSSFVDSIARPCDHTIAQDSRSSWPVRDRLRRHNPAPRPHAVRMASDGAVHVTPASRRKPAV